MNKFIIIILVLLIVSCNENKEKSNHELEIKVVKAFVEEGVNRNFDKVKAFLTPNCQEYSASIYADIKMTSDGVVNNWKDLHAKLDSLSFESIGTSYTSFEKGDLKGEWILDYGYMKGSYRGEKKILVRYHRMYQFNDLRISKIYNYTNVHDIFRQAGFTIVPPKSKHYVGD